MFKVMLNDYDPFVTIAAETNADRQVRLLAAKFADVFNHRDKYIELIMQEL